MLLTLPLLCFALLFDAISRRRQERGAQSHEATDPRGAFLAAAVLWGVVLTLITEGLSLFNWLTPLALTLCWAAATLAAALAAARVAPSRLLPRLERPASGGLLTLGLIAPIAIAILATGLIAIVGWPNNYDAMNYHLSRVGHWAQNQSVGFYPTHISHQLYYPPWAEYAVLHLTLPGGDDRYANFVQWFAMLGSLAGASLIAKRLGAGPRGQLFSALFCATLPMGILQASSTQNDYVASFWLVCLTERLLAWKTLATGSDGDRPPSIVHSLGVGGSLGLALLTKGTAYLFALPLLAIPLTGRASGRFNEWKHAALIALVVLGLNGPHYARNFQLYGWVLGPSLPGAPKSLDDPQDQTNESLSLPILLSNLVRNTALHLGTPFPAVNTTLEDAIRSGHAWLGIDPDDPRSTWLRTSFRIPPVTTNENRAGNPLHLLLIVGACLALAASPRSRQTRQAGTYAVVLLVGFALFSLLLSWQPFHSRLHLPLFVLWSPVVGVVLQHASKTLLAAGVSLSLWALPFLFLNASHPLLGGRNVFTMPRLEQSFVWDPDLEGRYVGATDVLRGSGCGDVGLVLEWFDWDFPLWVLLPEARSGGGRIEHVAVANSSGRLRGPWSDFIPCAVITLGPSAGALELGGRAYRRAWTEGRVTVFLADQEPPKGR